MITEKAKLEKAMAKLKRKIEIKERQVTELSKQAKAAAIELGDLRRDFDRTAKRARRANTPLEGLLSNHAFERYIERMHGETRKSVAEKLMHNNKCINAVKSGNDGRYVVYIGGKYCQVRYDKGKIMTVVPKEEPPSNSRGR